MGETENFNNSHCIVVQRLPWLPENRVISLSFTQSTSDSSLIEEETPQSRIVERPASTPLIREHKLQKQEKKGHREQNDTGESLTIIHLGRRTRTKGGESVELVI